MKRTILLWSLGGLLALAACAQPAPETTETETAVVQDTEAAEAAIRALVDEFLAGFNAGDAESLASQYAEDAVQMAPDGPPTEGPEAIVRSIAEFMAGYTATQTATVDEVSVHGDIAFARGSWNVRQTPVAGGEEEVRNGKWLTICQQQADGSWQVWRWIWNQESASMGEAATESM